MDSNSTERIAKPRTVLVADDDLAFGSFEVQLLSSQGYNVLQAGTGTEALRLADTQSVDLLLTDFLMPDFDGLELTRKFQIVHPNTPVLMVSGLLLPTDQRLKYLTRFGFLPKPFAIDELLLKVRALMGPSPSVSLDR